MRPEITLNVYTNSKTTVSEEVTDTFELLDSKRCGRVKVRAISSNKEYWVDSDEWDNKGNEDIIEEPMQRIIETCLSSDKVFTATTYTVKRGDTISTIANKFNVSESHLININGIDRFSVGQVIRIS